MTVGGPPSGAVLHWDADIDAFSEQTGGVHTFEHSVLSPQYQRNADGSYSNVGAKPAVDVFGGEKWLRSCGAVTNLQTVEPGGAYVYLSYYEDTDIVGPINGPVRKFYVNEGYSTGRFAPPINVIAGNTYTYSRKTNKILLPWKKN